MMIDELRCYTPHKFSEVGGYDFWTTDGAIRTFRMPSKQRYEHSAAYMSITSYRDLLSKHGVSLSLHIFIVSDCDPEYKYMRLFS